MSEVMAFDTHRFVKNLTASGFSEAQAEALAEEQAHLLNANLATKSDIHDTKSDIHDTRADIHDTRADVQENRVRIEQVKSDLEVKIEQLKTELQRDLGAIKASLLKWIVTALIAQSGLIVTVMAK